ncbi:MAG: respiratory nitrate reductase subunit gamma, partial [Anaerolineae bacterium]
MLDTVLFIAFPYVAVILATVVGIYRYYSDRFSFSSFSS